MCFHFQNGRWGEAERAVETLWGSHSLKTAMADLKAGEMKEGEREVGWGDLVSRRYIKGEGGRNRCACMCLYRGFCFLTRGDGGPDASFTAAYHVFVLVKKSFICVIQSVR